MKVRHVFSVVIGVHLAVIALLFVTPGCQSGSGGSADGGTDGRGGLTATDTAPEYARHARQWQTGPVYTQQGSGESQLYSPTRPEWNVNENTSVAAVSSVGNDESVEVLQPVRGAGSSQPASFTELVGVTSETGTIDPYAGGGVASSYTVQKGDNLTKIANRHGVSVNALMAANGLTRETANRIRVGQQLAIPAGGSVAPVSGQAPESAATFTSGEVYVVVSGDTLGGIAHRHGTSVSALRSANNISGDRITVGQKLQLPSGSAAPAPSSQRSVAAPSSTSSNVTAPVAAGEGEYVVRRGDTLGGIAARHGTSVQSLMDANGIDDPRRLREGQKLKLPNGSSSKSSTSGSSSAPTQRPASSQSSGSSSSSTTTTLPTVTPEPVPTIPSAPSGIGGGSFGGQGSGDDLLNDLDNIPTVPAVQ